MPELLRLEAPIELQAAADDRTKPAKISILAYGGAVMRVPAWGNVAIDLAGLEIPGSVPLLSDHEANLDSIIGAGVPSVEHGQLFVAGTLAESDTSRKVIALFKSGVPFGASVGVEPTQTETIRAGSEVSINSRTIKADGRPFQLVKRGRLREVSVVGIGADPTSAVSIAAKAASQSKGNTMPDTDNYVVTGDDKTRLEANFHSATPDPDLEQRRLRIIDCWTPRNINAKTHPELAESARLLRARAVNGECSLDELRHEAEALLNASRPTSPAIHGSNHDRQPDILAAAFCQSAGLPGIEKHFDAPTLDAAHTTFRGGAGLGEVLLLCAQEGGYSGRPVVRAGNLREILQAAFSTHTLTTVLSTTGNKFLLDGFNSVEQVWKSISRSKAVKDFKETTSYRLTGDLVFEELPPAGEIKHGTVGQESYTNQARTYAKMLELTRQDIINDDLGAFDDLRNRLGRGAALKLNAVFWAALLDNASFFTEARGNLQTGASTALAEDGTALAAAEKLFLDLSDDDGHPLGIEPSLLLVPTALSVTGRKLYASAEMRDTTSSTTFQTTNLFYNRFKPLTSAYLGANNTNGSDTAWWLLADAANLATMEVCFLDGVESPTIESADADFNTLGIQTRGYFDFGCAKSEWRAGVMSDGTDG